jgi:hypothetical protein
MSISETVGWPIMALDAVFDTFNQRYFAREQITYQQLRQEFEAPTNEYFNLNHTPADHNSFFGRFTQVWINMIENRMYFDAIRLWNFAINLAVNWERQNRPYKIHKGTPFYFLGVSGILNNELDNGFLAMHQAVEEDKRLSGRRLPEAPAFWFVTLDYTRQDQFFREKVEQIANYLSERLVTYSEERDGSLTLDQFRTRLLRRRRLMEEVFLFVYSLFKLRKTVVETSEIYKKNTLSSIMHAKLLFDLSVVVDKIIEYKNPRRLRPNTKLVFSNELIFLSMAPRRLLSFNVGNKIGTLNADFEDLAGTLRGLLRGTYDHLTLSDIEKDFAITYGIRNFGAHKIENQPYLYNNMPRISQSILNSLFYIVEKIY